MSNSTTLQVVTTSVGYGPYPIPYPVRYRPYAQSRMPESDRDELIVGSGLDDHVIIVGFNIMV
jgi:hypothetical protein